MTDPIPFGRLLTERARATPSAALLTIAGETLSCTELEAIANRRARQLAAADVRKDDLVTIALPNSRAFYEFVWACWKLGATPNPVSAKLPAAEFDAITALVRPRAIVSFDKRSAGEAAIIDAASPPVASLSDLPLPDAVATYWKAMTSGGSTGRPKVIVDHSPGAWSPAWPTLLQRPGSVVLNPGPLYHNAPFISVMLAMLGGGRVIDMVRFDAEGLLAAIAEHRVTWINLVPTMMNRVWRLDPAVRAAHDVSSLETVFHMGAPCPSWLKQAWIEWLGPDRIFELYAGTERQGNTIISGRDWLARPGSVGKVMPGAAIRILDDQGRDCAPGIVGEIFFRPDEGRGATYHYLGAEPKAVGEWESLGDLGWLDDDGYLYLADRRTDLILSGGANVYPAEVEAALGSHPDVLDAVVIGLPDEDLGQRVHAIVQQREGTVLSLESLRAHLADRLLSYKCPRSAEFVSEAIRDEAGKVRRSLLAELRSEQLSRETAAIVPSGQP